MADPVVCSYCGARNPAEAEWCGQCFSSLGINAATRPDGSDDSIRERVDLPESAVPVRPPTPTDGEAEPSSPRRTKARVWVCSVCETPNPLDAQHCAACGTSIFASFGAEDEEHIDVDPQRALLRSVLFPGLGHAYAQQGLLGSAVGGLTVMALGFGGALVATGVGRFGWPLILLAIAIWVAAALDAFRLAEGQTDSLLLRPRVLTALVGLVMVVVILAGFLRGGA